MLNSRHTYLHPIANKQLKTGITILNYQYPLQHSMPVVVESCILLLSLQLSLPDPRVSGLLTVYVIGKTFTVPDGKGFGVHPLATMKSA